jgi:hypothetical protein
MGVVLGGVLAAPARAANAVTSTVLNAPRPLLEKLSRDTINGFAAFVVPGPDADMALTPCCPHSPGYFGGDPWVGRESPVVSTDSRVTAGMSSLGL